MPDELFNAIRDALLDSMATFDAQGDYLSAAQCQAALQDLVAWIVPQVCDCA